MTYEELTARRLLLLDKSRRWGPSLCREALRVRQELLNVVREMLRMEAERAKLAVA